MSSARKNGRGFLNLLEREGFIELKLNVGKNGLTF